MDEKQQGGPEVILFGPCASWALTTNELGSLETIIICRIALLNFVCQFFT